MLMEKNQQLEPGMVIVEPGGLYAVSLESRTISSVDLLQLDTSPFHTTVGLAFTFINPIQSSIDCQVRRKT